MAKWTDDEVVAALTAAAMCERQAREALDTEDQAERDECLTVLRHVTVLRRALEGWIGRRAVRRGLGRS